jgi:hypothetical protein
MLSVTALAIAPLHGGGSLGAGSLAAVVGLGAALGLGSLGDVDSGPGLGALPAPPLAPEGAGAGLGCGAVSVGAVLLGAVLLGAVLLGAVLLGAASGPVPLAAGEGPFGVVVPVVFGGAGVRLPGSALGVTPGTACGPAELDDVGASPGLCGPEPAGAFALLSAVAPSAPLPLLPGSALQATSSSAPNR